jgi:hypothetical protein
LRTGDDPERLEKYLEEWAVLAGEMRERREDIIRRFKESQRQ